MRVYPRVCGGTSSTDRRTVIAWGLSPRVRGNPIRRTVQRRERRSIPACAGEPQGKPEMDARQRVYPRVCGGTHRPESRGPRNCGLSPRVRGNPPARKPRPPKLRSIPACAGEPPRCRGSPWSMWVYPRVCGGTSEPDPHHGNGYGLSPRVRGNRLDLRSWSCGVGSIPACAGEPPRHEPANQPYSVYPRVCGGTLLVRLALLGRKGLSPRVRGNLKTEWAYWTMYGSIPACVWEPFQTW